MQRSRSALVVAATPALAAHVIAWLKRSGWQVVAAQSYRAARTRLEQGPDLLVTEVELADYNGLQLALRAQAQHIPTVLIGRHDTVLEREAEQFGAMYLHKEELDQHRLGVAIEVKLDALNLAIPAPCRNVEFAKRPWSDTRSSATSRRIVLH